ncbi:MAG TPA: insulinase family protein, partial [Armatimonadota bacterium]|nr:insulinase family protein [Armatimonadota bacterium]
LTEIVATIPADQSAAAAEAAINHETDRLCRYRVTKQELAKAVHQDIAAFVFGDEGAAGQAAAVGYYDVVADVRLQDHYLSEISSVTPADIQRVASKYFVAGNRTTGWVMLFPTKPAPPHAAGANLLDESPGIESPTSPGSSGVVNQLQSSPLPGPLAHRPITRRVLSNGLTVLIYPSHSSPTVAIDCEIDAGALDDPPGLAGLANAAVTLAHWRTAPLDGWKLDQALDSMGARISTGILPRGALFEARCLMGDYHRTMDLLADEVIYPIYPSRGLKSLRRDDENDERDLRLQPISVATRAMDAALYPPGSPYHVSEYGIPETRERMTAADLDSFHNRYYRPDRTTIAVVGDIDVKTALNTVQQFFGRWEASGPPPPDPTPPPARERPARIVKVIPGAPETAIEIGSGGIARSCTDYYAAALMNSILGGTDFTGRLERDLRERQGLVYYVGSYWDAEPIAGPWRVSMQTAPGNVNRAVASTIAEIRGMQQTLPTPGEMTLLKNWMAGSRAVSLQTNEEIARSLLYAAENHLSPATPWTYPAYIAAVTPEQVRAAARRYLHPDHLVISIAGP